LIELKYTLYSFKPMFADPKFQYVQIRGMHIRRVVNKNKKHR